MSAITLHGLKNCDTCRKALKALEAAGHHVTFNDVRADGVTKTQLEQWEKEVGFEVLLNTRSTTWRGLSDSDKADINKSRALALIKDHPSLMKRPLIETPKEIFVGWTKQVQEKFE